MSDPTPAPPGSSFIGHARCERLGTYTVVAYDQVRTIARPRLDAKYVFLAVTGGALTLLYEGRKWRAPAGSLVVIPPFRVHGEYPASTGWSGLSVHVSASAVNDILQGDSALRSVEPVHDARHLTRYLARIPELLVDERTAASLVIENVVLHVARAADTSPRMEPSRPSRQRRIATLAREYLHALPGDEIPSLDQLMELTGVSRFYLCRVFRRETGLPPYAYYSQLRLARARELLDAGVGVAAAAFRLGFSDQSHFTRQFKRLAATTPGRYSRALGQPRKR